MKTKTKSKKSTKALNIIPEASNAGDVEYFCTSGSTNTKTGNVPTIWIGKDKAQVARTCCEAGCPLLPTHKGGTFKSGRGVMGCYAWAGTVQMAVIQLWRRAKNHPLDYKVKNALSNSALAARFVRVSAIGDPGSLTVEQTTTIIEDIKSHNEEYRTKKNELRILGYTHAWETSPEWKGHLAASVHSLEEADEAFDAGWKPALEVKISGDVPRMMKTPKGRNLLTCPHLLSEDEKPKLVPDCNACGWCSVEKSKQTFGIVFPNHK